jgi:Leucine-rich repeat (LRR) protein
MNKSTLKAIIVFTFILIWIFPIGARSQQGSTADANLAKAENYKEQIRRLMGFLEFSLNTLGSSETSTKEKEIIINESYLKAFLHDKVQIEDDLDENREILTYKDVQAYLKDVDFFFKEATFTIDIQDIQPLTNDLGITYFKVTANRNLSGITVNDEIINNNKTRYIEINLDEDEQVLKIASIYTTRLNEAQEMMVWWNAMPSEWKIILGSDYIVMEDSTRLSQIEFINDTTFLFVHEVPDVVQYESFIYIGNDSLLIIENDTVFKEIYDTVPAGKNNSLRMLKEITKRESLEVPGDLSIQDLYPVDQMSELRSLNISKTLISDLFPARNLTKLVSLNISGTGISDLGPIRYNTRIRELYLDSSSVTTLSPIQDFASLETLHFNNTQVDSLYPIRRLNSLKDLRMDNTPISDISFLGELKNLENLSMSGTQINSLFSLQNLVSLRRINFENTRIDNLNPLAELDKLQIIDADQTLIADLKPIGYIPLLEKVYCDQTRITSNQANAFMAAHPKVLIIYESQALTSWWAGLNLDWQNVFKGNVNLDPKPTTEQLHQLTMLSQINIEGNDNITSLVPLAKLTNLKEIQASGTSISDISPLSELKDLKILSCSSTRVSSLLPLQSLVQLEKLDFSNTLLDSLDGLNTLSRLQILQIDRTSVDNLQPVINCMDLRIIYCDNTKVGKVDIDKFLDSHHNCLVIFQSNLLKSWWNSLLPAWKTVLRTHSEVDEPPTREQLQILAGLNVLDMAGNREITSLEPLTTLDRLEELSLANNTLQDITPLRVLVKLRKLNLSGNPVFNLSPISTLPNLKHLDISNTAITKLDAIKNLVSLEYVNCSGTQIKKLDPVANLSNLKKLECFNTGISNLKPLTGLFNLRQLVCYNTKLSKKKVEAFKLLMPGLEVVFY